MKDQRGLRMHVTALDFADENDVIAFRVAAAVMAFKPGRRAVQNR